MKNTIYQNRCGSCQLFEEAAYASLDDGFLRNINYNGIKKDETRFMHATDFERVGVGCIHSNNKDKITEAYSNRPPICQ